MDTTLMTFHLQTTSSTHSVHLIGSWDNFMKHYPMERDIRRAHGQWRGCYKFEDIICDGDGGTSPKRTGGLKMGSTYYYYYELDDGTEIHDATLPSTTSCPYLPGQPVNLLSVPVEIQPLRYRSASLSSMAIENMKTMEPADKFIAPRPPPPPPTGKRVKTSPAPRLRKRTARSVSPKPPKSPWSPKAFFGIRSSVPVYVQERGMRGRSTSSLTKPTSSASSTACSAPQIHSHSDNEKKLRSGPHTRACSPQSVVRTRSREPSPLGRFVAPEMSSYNPAVLVIPDEIEEDDAEDDDNFASYLHRISLSDRGILTPLAPPPSTGLRFPNLYSTSGTSTPKDTSKPLPMLPEGLALALSPSPLRLRVPAALADMVPRSHFSTSTISTTLTSPTESHFGFSETPSIADSNDDEGLSADIGSGDDSAYSPVKDVETRFTGYSLPDADYNSEQSLQKVVSPLTQTAGRTPFVGAASYSPSTETDVKSLSALEQLLSEMGYLGDVITGK